MRVLIACEESQVVCKAFRARGHEAFSCDILPTSGDHPEWHLQCDVFDVLNEQWDIMIAFPPCTHLCVSGARWFKNKEKEQGEAIHFVRSLVANGPGKVAIENPIGILSNRWKKPTQIINPYDFGDAAQKPTCLWLAGLPKLKATTIDAPLFGLSIERGEFHTTKSGKKLPKWYNLPPSPDRARIRSKTFPGIAKAMAEQWG